MVSIERQREYRRKSYHKNRTKQLADMKARRQAYKDACYGAYGGYVCRCCGVTEPSMLALDHINNNGFAHRKQVGYRGGAGLYLWIIKEHFPPIFQVLCYNCNQSKRINNGTCAHKLDRSTPAIPQGATNG